MQGRISKKQSSKKRDSLACQLEEFLISLPGGQDISSCSVKDVLRFLAFKDISGGGKTQVHDSDCEFVGRAGVFDCECPCRLSAEYLKRIVTSLKAIFRQAGRGESWDIRLQSGNPAAAPQVSDYTVSVQEEQAEAHVVKKQANPLFPEKLIRLSEYLLRECRHVSSSVLDRFLFLRDRAFFLLQFYLGERGGDLLKLLFQEVYRGQDDEGLVIRQTYGKLRAENLSYVPRCNGSSHCPVTALDQYVQGVRAMGVELTSGFVFRKLSSYGWVLDTPLTQTGMTRRLVKYLSAIGAYDGETTHSLRGGLAILLKLHHGSDSGSASHVGWRTQAVWEHYSRSQLLESREVAQTLLGIFQTEDDDVLAGKAFNALDCQKLSRAYV